jgi:probable HAF family extracellular repeat protein
MCLEKRGTAMKLSERILVLLLLVALPLFAQQYKKTQLSQGGGTSVAFAVNSHGRATGEFISTSGETHAFLWTKATGKQDLGTRGATFPLARQ